MKTIQWIKDPIHDILNQAAESKCGKVGICETISLCELNCEVLVWESPEQQSEAVVIPEL